MYRKSKNEEIRWYSDGESGSRRETRNITWRVGKNGDTSLWILTTKRLPNEAPKTHRFQEKSDYGVLEGTVVINEH